MKVKKLWVGIINRDSIERVVITREVSFVKKIIKLSLNDMDTEYKCIFTNKSYWFKKADIESFIMYLSIDQLKKRMKREEIKQVYKEKEEDMRLQLTKKTKPVMGFRNTSL